MKIAFYGSSLLSSYWNGAATYYRGLLADLARRGHSITFYEPDAFDRQQHRGAKLDAGHAAAHRSQQGQRIMPRTRQQRVACPNRIKTEIRRALGKRDERRRLRSPRHHLLAIQYVWPWRPPRASSRRP